MELLVCIKQVPDTSEIKLDPETNTLIRTGLPSIVNPFDMNALEAALEIKDKVKGAVVSVITMGPPQADAALRECLTMGADKAYLISDRAFAGADTLATSYTIASAIKKLQADQGRPFDLILCGKQAIDGDTAQVGPQIAEELGIPQITYVNKVSLIADDNDEHILPVEDQESAGAAEPIAEGSTVTAIQVEREHEEGYEVLEVKLPALITAVKTLNEPRYPTLWNSIRAIRSEVTTITAADMTVESERLGLSGSPTRVRKVYSPPVRSKGLIIQDETPAEAVKSLMNVLEEKKVI